MGRHQALKPPNWTAKRNSIILLTLLFLLGGIVFATSRFFSSQHTADATDNPIGITVSSGEQIGLSDGSYAFDTNRPDGILKNEAATQLRQGNTLGAQDLWQQALHLPDESNDAEALIYLEDQYVLALHKPYITLVVGTTLTGNASDISTGRDDLQGAYVAQKEYNDGYKLKNGLLVRLLIANAGSKSANVADVAQRIVQASLQNLPIAGVMGWPDSTYSIAAVHVLAPAHISMVSQTASSDALTGISPFFFRIAPSNRSQAIAGANYAESQLYATRVAIFEDPNDGYSSNLAKDFANQFISDGHQIVATENYTVGAPNTIPVLLQNALSNNPDLIYFAGYADDIGTLLTDLGTSNPEVKVMGGDGLYQPKGYPSSARSAFNRLRFTAFAHPGEWDAQGSLVARLKPTFFTTYASDFDPKKQYPLIYGYGRPDNDAMLSYDAMLALLQAANNVLAGNNSLTPTLLQSGLHEITGAQAIQGVSGQISFGSDGDPLNKAVVVLYVDQNNYIQIYQVKGCFLTPSLGGSACS